MAINPGFLELGEIGPSFPAPASRPRLPGPGFPGCRVRNTSEIRTFGLIQGQHAE